MTPAGFTRFIGPIGAGGRACDGSHRGQPRDPAVGAGEGFNQQFGTRAMKGMTTKQRRFAVGVVAGLTRQEAAAQAGYRLWRQQGEKAAANPRVKALIADLRRAMAACRSGAKHGPGESAAGREPPPLKPGSGQGGRTHAEVTAMLNADRRLAYRQGAAGAAVSASVAIARVNGLIVDRRQLDARTLGAMSDGELMRHLEALAARGRKELTAGRAALPARGPAE